MKGWARSCLHEVECSDGQRGEPSRRLRGPARTLRTLKTEPSRTHRTLRHFASHRDLPRHHRLMLMALPYYKMPQHDQDTLQSLTSIITNLFIAEMAFKLLALGCRLTGLTVGMRSTVRCTPPFMNHRRRARTAIKRIRQHLLPSRASHVTPLRMLRLMSWKASTR